jgi:hypothetical protein
MEFRLQGRDLREQRLKALTSALQPLISLTGTETADTIADNNNNARRIEFSLVYVDQ